MTTHRIWMERRGWGWHEALPTGNGRLGAMWSGAVAGETIWLNEESIWAHQPGERTNPHARGALDEVRRLLMDGRPVEAFELADSHMMGNPRRLQPYQPLGELQLHLPRHQSSKPEAYVRELNMRDGIARVEYRYDGVTYTRELLCSLADDVIAVRLEASEPGHLTMLAELQRKLGAQPGGQEGCLTLEGRASGEGTHFAAVLEADVAGGQVQWLGDKLRIVEADAVTLIISAGTDFRGGEPRDEADRRLKAIQGKSWDDLRERHVEAHRALYDRVDLTLGEDDDLPTDQRLQRVMDGGDPDPTLDALCFNFARYLLIGSSQPGGLPANLQGVWNPLMTPPWESDIHTNINVQMNYWPAEVCDLGDHHTPLFNWMTSIMDSGRRTAEVHYGCRGWVLHHISDPWGFTVPGGSATCGLWPTGGAWLCDHLWEHYLYTNDREFLGDCAWPLLREASLFFLDFCVEDEQGQLLSGPSSSPENRYRLPDGTVGHLCMGPTMDSQIIRELWTHTLDAAEVLGLDEELLPQLREAREKLPPNRIGKHGQLMEWAEDYDEPEPGHRHTSHLFGLHPACQISRHDTPELAEAAAVTIDRRLAHLSVDGLAGWGLAWMMHFNARLGRADDAHANQQLLLKSGTLCGLWTRAHGQVQVDAALGRASGIAEMLLQSHGGRVCLLPALPSAWPSGRVRNLRARGGLGVDMAWQGGRLAEASVTARWSGPQTLQVGTGRRIETVRCGDQVVEVETHDDGAVSFQAEAGQRYDIDLS